MATKKRTPEETWKALEAQAEADEIERFMAMDMSEVEARLRQDGHDPDAIRAEGRALSEKLSKKRESLAWQVEAAEGLAKERARIEAQRGKYEGLPRAELLARIDSARKDPRFSQPVAIRFRNRNAADLTDDELRAILVEIEGLASRKGGS